MLQALRRRGRRRRLGRRQGEGRTGNANWQYYVGAPLGTNAIGALLVDPRDASGNTVYAGTGEPNASGDSEAGIGIYKTTDGGDTWALVPGSDLFRDRAIGDDGVRQGRQSARRPRERDPRASAP